MARAGESFNIAREARTNARLPEVIRHVCRPSLIKDQNRARSVMQDGVGDTAEDQASYALPAS